jgi:hypothetical protein
MRAFLFAVTDRSYHYHIRETGGCVFWIEAWVSLGTGHDDPVGKTPLGAEKNLHCISGRIWFFGDQFKLYAQGCGFNPAGSSADSPFDSIVNCRFVLEQ